MAKKLKKKIKNESISIARDKVKSNPFYVAVVILWGIYLFFNLYAPNTTTNQFHISQPVLNILKLTVAIPYLLIWLAASYSYIKIKRYAVTIKPSKESYAFEKIANGIILLLGSLILSSLISALRSYYIHYSQVRPMLTILSNYAYVLPYLFAFVLLYNGVIGLVSKFTDLTIQIKKSIIYGLPLILFSYVWLEFIFGNKYRMTPSSASPFATYYLKDSMVILTIVIPSLVTWAIGLIMSLQLKLYQQKVEGIIYKKALLSFVYGFIGIIFGSVFIQAVLSLGAQRLVDLGLEKILFVIYIFLFVQALGFFLIARGANNLTKIEAV